MSTDRQHVCSHREHDRHLVLMDAARSRARELRDQALDELWLDTGAAARRSLRSATRLAQRLARHALIRNAGGRA